MIHMIHMIHKSEFFNRVYFTGFEQLHLKVRSFYNVLFYYYKDVDGN